MAVSHCNCNTLVRNDLAMILVATAASMARVAALIAAENEKRKRRIWMRDSLKKRKTLGATQIEVRLVREAGELTGPVVAHILRYTPKCECPSMLVATLPIAWMACILQKTLFSV